MVKNHDLETTRRIQGYYDGLYHETLRRRTLFNKLGGYNQYSVRLRERMKALNLKNKDVAQLIGVTESAVSHWRNRDPKNLIWLDVLLQELGVH